MTIWFDFFESLSRQFRASGGTCAFIVHRQSLHPIGTAPGFRYSLVHHNDNALRFRS